MNMSQLIEELSERTGYHPHDTDRVVRIFFDSIKNAIAQKDKVEIRGFGTYKITKRKARTGRNPKNSETIQIPERKKIKWKMSKILYNRLNKNFTENKISDTH